MKHIFWLLLFPLVLTAIDDKNGDFQLWTYATVQHKLNSCNTITFTASNRRDDNATRSYYNYGEVAWDHNLCDSWSVTLVYRHIYKKRVNSHNKTWWRPDSNPHIDLTKSWKFCSFKLEDRNEFEYLSQARYWKYRNRITISYPSRLTPFISNEFFWKKAQRFDQNRLQCGFSTSLCDRLKGTIAYMWRSKEISSGWIHQHVLVLKAAATF